MTVPTMISITKTPKIAIIGNPNVGKSTIFNQLTGLNQKIGNYPGVTVDKKVGTMSYQGSTYEIIDLPGTYSLYPNSEDEVIAHRVLNQLSETEKPEYVLMVIDSSQLSRGLFLATQLIDLGLNLAIVLNMADLATKRNISIRTFEIFKALGVPILSTDARGEKGLDQIRELIHTRNFSKKGSFLAIEEVVPITLLEEVKRKFNMSNNYQAYQMLRFGRIDKVIAQADRDWIKSKLEEINFDLAAAQLEETKIRYRKITKIVDQAVVKESHPKKEKSGLDSIFLHPVLGYVIFAAILLIMFQAIFAWASVPMDLIDGFFAELSGKVSGLLPSGPISSLISEGIIPGIGGVVIFIPQIAMLFGFLAILEDTGYMSRVVFLMDRWMRPFGLHGKSVVPLVSGVACAIPGVMAARNIGNWKEKIITIMVTPLMSCSARLPVYVILIGLVVPNKTIAFVNLQALTLLGLYFLGIIGVLGTAFLLKNILKTTEKSFLMVELPSYRAPRWWDVILTMYNKSRTFVMEAGKVILAISVILWVLASYGPPSRMDEIRSTGEQKLALATSSEMEEQIQAETSSLLLENSFIGIMGRGIEPVIRPLGYDWKIGIALIASFAAREVFVSTIATIYSIGGDPEDDLTIRQKLNQQIRPDGEKVYNTATAFSLMIFYAFAMQCMSTLAVVYRETKGWKWPLIQTVYMTALAYLSALLVYQILS
ncbi:ferrous iron transport protein B [Algoriphagus marinus]|uniref:ferrous iron transport protein B n=1 Tax=Algoriphagus marinus TaxID=1925762 RepID=UPI00094B91E2|nr:ferrous iron transport protein B [Algoriphagus marinus]